MRWPTTQLIVLTVAGLLAAIALLPARDRPPLSTPQAAPIGGVAFTPVTPPRLPDPFPIRRVFRTDEPIDALPSGGWRKLPRDEFETRVREASAAQMAARTPPTLVRAAYQATYSPGQMAGKLTWAFANPNGSPGVAPLDSLKVAIGPPTWTGGREAVLFKGKLARRALPGLHLLVEPSATELSAEWSVRGSIESDQERFEVGVPTAAVSTLEVTLPADRTLRCNTDGVVLTGPFPAAGLNERVWKLAFGGLSNVVLLTRRMDSTAGQGLPASRIAKYELTPGEVRASFEFADARNAERERVFDVDPGLRVTGVLGRPTDGWKYEPGALPTTPGRLRVSGTTDDVRLAVTCTSPLSPGVTSFDFPAVRPSGASVVSDTFDVLVHPELNLAGWEPGDYRAAVFGQQGDRSFRLQFVGSFTAQAGERRKPTVRVQPTDTAYVTDEVLDWTVSAGQARLIARVKVKAVRGPVTAVSVACDPDYVLDFVTQASDDTAVEFHPLPDRPGGWVIEPTRAITTGQTVELRLDFHGQAAIRAADPSDASPNSVPLAFPAFHVAAVDRTGVLNVRGSGLRATARTSATTESLGPGEFAVPFRSRIPAGESRFTPDRATATLTRLDLAVSESTSITLAGVVNDIPVGSLTVFAPLDVTAVKVPGATVRKMPPPELFHLLATPGWGSIAALATSQATQGSYWQVNFPRPFQGDFLVTVVSPPRTADAGKPLPVPLPTLCGANVSGVTLSLSPELRAAYRVPDPIQTAAAVKTFPAKLDLLPKAADTTERSWSFADLRMITTVSTDRTDVVFSGRVLDATGPTLPIRLPAGATFETARVGQKWATVQPNEDTIGLPLPDVPSGGIPFEVRYQLPKPTEWLAVRNDSPCPELPNLAPVSSTWVLTGGLLPWPTLDAAAASGTVVTTIPLSLVWAIGVLAAGVVLFIGVWLIWRGNRLATLAIAGVLIGTGIVGWLTPNGWWALVRPSLVVGLAAWVTALACGSRRRGGPLSALGVLIAALLTPLSAQQAEPFTVYVVNGVGGRLDVYAPPPLLDALSEHTSSPLPAVVITRAEYTGSISEGIANLEATYSLINTQDGPQSLTVPLAGVRLERATVDGVEVFPDATKSDRYSIPIAKGGRHELALRFAVNPVMTGLVREVRFTGPEVPVCRVRFGLPSSSSSPEVVTRRGGQSSHSSDGRIAVTAEHGGDGTIAIRWREGTGTRGAGAVASAWEAGVWDVSETDPAVTVAVMFRIRDGMTDRLSMEIPAGMRVVRMSANGVGVRTWTAGMEANGWVPIDVSLTSPTEGPVTVVMRAAAMQPLSATSVLRFPRARGLPATDRDSVYGVRFTGSQATEMTLAGAIDYPPDALVRDFPAVPEFEFDRSPPARVMRRVATAETELRLTLVPIPGVSPGASEVVFSVGRWVEVEGAFRATGKEVGHLEFDIPESCELRDVRAPDLAGWTRTGSRIKVWLTQPTTNLTVRWTGSVNRSGERFTLPLPRWPKGLTPSEPLTVRVKSTTGWAVSPHEVTGMQMRLTETLNELVFTAEPNASATFSVAPLSAAPPRPAEPLTRPTPPVPPEPAAQTIEVTPPPSNEADSPSGWYWARALVWLLALATTLAVSVVGGARWWPECLAGVGVLGAAMLGPLNPIGAAFAVAATVAAGWRIAWLVRRRVPE